MKRVRIKNQIIITTLVIMIAVSGYISFKVSESQGTQNAIAEIEATGNVAKADSDNQNDKELQDMEDAGEAVIASSKAITDYIATAKLNREQTRAKVREELNTIIDNTSLSKEARDEASKALVEETTYQNAEVAIETLLVAKGFKNAIVSITKESVDVIVDASMLSDSDLAKIQEVVMRKYKISQSKIVITPMRVQ